MITLHRHYICTTAIRIGNAWRHINLCTCDILFHEYSFFFQMMVVLTCTPALYFHYRSSQVYIVLGPISISDKASYCNISQSIETARFLFRIIRSLWNLTGTSAAVLPKCLSNFNDNLNYQSRSFETSRDLTIRRLIGYWNRVHTYISKQGLHWFS